MDNKLTPEQIAKWRTVFESQYSTLYVLNDPTEYGNESIESKWQGYLRAMTEQTAEIDALKAQLAESVKALSEVLEFQSAKSAPSIHDYGRWRRLESTITKLLKG